MRRARRWLPRAAFESLIVVFSILLALGVNEWQKARERQARMAVAVESVRAEIGANLREVADAESYHSSLVDTLSVLAAAGVPAIGSELHPRGVILSPNLVATAWESARATGTVADMPYETVMLISRVYERQARYHRRSEELLRGLYDGLLRTGNLDFLHREYGVVRNMLNDVANWERGLIEAYESTLEELGESWQ